LIKNPYIAFSRIFLLLVLVMSVQGCYKEEIIEIVEMENVGESFLKFDQVDAFIDLSNKFMLFTIPSDTIYDFTPDISFHTYSSVQISGKELINDQKNILGNITINLPYEVIAKNETNVDTFKILFTRLPLMHVITDNKIKDEPKVFSRIFIQHCDEDNYDAVNHLFYSYAGIEIRGATSAQYDKKSYGLELWRNKIGDEYSTSLLGMHIGEDWILDAMYIDDLRMRNKISFELWEKMSSVPEKDMKPDVVPGIHSEYVELFINNRYTGVYTLSEKLDPYLLHYSYNQSELGGVLYKAIEWEEGASTFNRLDSDPPEDEYWDGWEQIYPKESYNWSPLADLRDFVINSDNNDFIEGIGSLIDIANAVDYFLFINICLASDNAGKNTYLARYTDQSSFFYMPWDIEASWGLFWNRDKIDPYGLVTNHLFERLQSTNAENFNDLVSTQWADNSAGIFNKDSLMLPITSYYNTLKNSGVIFRENTRWSDINIDLNEEYEFVLNWIPGRIEYLNNYFTQE